jgi:plastocyanin
MTGARQLLMPVRALLVLTAVCAVPSVLVVTSAPAASTRTVVLRDIAFTPQKVTIRRGDCVRWRWNDRGTSHNVTSRGKARFKSSPIKSTGTYSVRFRRRGTYLYVCTLHPGMAGRVVVH